MEPQQGTGGFLKWRFFRLHHVCGGPCSCGRVDFTSFQVSPALSVLLASREWFVRTSGKMARLMALLEEACGVEESLGFEPVDHPKTTSWSWLRQKEADLHPGPCFLLSANCLGPWEMSLVTSRERKPEARPAYWQWSASKHFCHWPGRQFLFYGGPSNQLLLTAATMPKQTAPFCELLVLKTHYLGCFELQGYPTRLTPETRAIEHSTSQVLV